MEYYLAYIDEEGNEERLFVEDIRLTLTDEAESNSLEVTLPSNYVIENGESRIKNGEYFTVYATATFFPDTLTSDYLIGSFVVTDKEINEDDKIVKYICTDLTYKMLSGLFPRSISESDGQTALDIVDTVIQVAVQDGTTQRNTTTNIQQTRSDGSAFPVIAYSNAYKNNYEVIKELSQTEFTGDVREYLFYFTPNGDFYWEFPDYTLQSTQFDYITSNVIDMKLNDKKSDVLVYIIYNAGVDKNGNAIQGYYLKPGTSAIDGKQSFQPMTDISKLKKRELGSAYDTITNEEFINLCKDIATSRAKAIVDKTNKGTWKGTISVTPDFFNISKLYKVIGQNIPKIDMRIKRITHKINKNGWKIDLELNEDLEFT